MGKDKIRRFEENATFRCVVQPEFEEIFRKDYRLKGRWRVKQHLFDQHHGALFPLVDAFRSRSGPDAEDYQWLMHRARPALSVEDARLDGHWLRVDSLESNALALYEFTPQLSPGEDPDA